MTDVKTCLNEAQEKMDMATMYLEEALAHIRAGKATVGFPFNRSLLQAGRFERQGMNL